MGDPLTSADRETQFFDLDDDHTVGFVETLMPLESWEQTDDELAPGGARRGSLRVERPVGDGSLVGLAVDLS